MKRLEKVAKAKSEGKKLKRRTSKKQMMKYLLSGGALSADFKRVPKPGRTKS